MRKNFVIYAQSYNRYMNSVKYLEELRKEWADLQNREFERMGLDIHVSHESLAAQGIDREPTMHIGAATMALELQGIRTGRGDEYRGIIERNNKREREYQRDREHTWNRER
nr:MobA/MobL family protein [uncultured Acetatifactor sp.]